MLFLCSCVHILTNIGMAEVVSNGFEPERVLKPLYDATTLLLVHNEDSEVCYPHEEALGLFIVVYISTCL